MASKASRPIRTLLVFVCVIGLMYVLVAALGNWKPKLGLDLEGGTRITLQAKSSQGGVTSDKLNQAVDIISSRVNGAGVSEAQVSTQGSDIIIVEIPGKVDPNLSRTIGETAQLRFRIVATCPQLNNQPCILPPASKRPPATPTPTGPTSTKTQSTPSTPPTTSVPPTESSPSNGQHTTGSKKSTTPPTHPPTTAKTTKPTGPQLGNSSPGKRRVGAGWLRKGGTATPQSGGATATPLTGKNPPAPPVTPPPALTPPQLEKIPDPYAWSQNPPASDVAKLETYKCPGTPGAAKQPPQADLPSQPLLACDSDGNRYLLGPAMVEGTDVTNASAGIPQGQVAYAVDLTFNSHGAREFGDVTSRIAINGGTGQQLAIVLDEEVLSAPTNEQPITGGQAQITGSSTNPFTQAQASSLATALKYGALPLTFVDQGQELEGPELASSQLDAGILAGIIGLLLVVGYCLLYYRALGMVVIASLVIAGLIAYAAVLLLGHAYGFTLTLPGIAGLIVAVGITADSFIVYFERLRDEVRDGRTLRTSVETGWVRARQTILAADAVSMLAALILYIFAIDVVKGFAFALGLTTFIDVFVVFFFTKPVVTLLARTHFFGQGHKFSGLDRQHLGLPPLKRQPATAGGEA